MGEVACRRWSDRPGWGLTTEAGLMQRTVRLEARTSQGELKTTEPVTFSRPAVIGTLAEVGLLLDETKALLARLQASMLCGQVTEYAAHHRACAACGVLQPLKDRRTRRLQTLRHGPGRGAAVQGVPLPPLCDPGVGTDGLAGLRAADHPLHAGAGAGAGRVGRTHLVSGRGTYPGGPAAGVACEPGKRAQPRPRGRLADRGGRPASSYGGHGCPGAGRGRSGGSTPARRHARRRLHTCGAGSPGSDLRGDLRQGGA